MASIIWPLNPRWGLSNVQLLGWVPCIGWVGWPDCNGVLSSWVASLQWNQSTERCGAIALLKDNKFHAHTKHINICYHFIWESVADGKISVKYIPTNDNTADIFTKPLAKAKFHHFTEILWLRSIKMNTGAWLSSHAWSVYFLYPYHPLMIGIQIQLCQICWQSFKQHVIWRKLDAK